MTTWTEEVGKTFRAHDGHLYVADSYDPRHGFWMTRVDCPDCLRSSENHPEWRRSVSERAIGRTFHTVPNQETDR